MRLRLIQKFNYSKQCKRS